MGLGEHVHFLIILEKTSVRTSWLAVELVYVMNSKTAVGLEGYHITYIFSPIAIIFQGSVCDNHNNLGGLWLIPLGCQAVGLARVHTREQGPP